MLSPSVSQFWYYSFSLQCSYNTRFLEFQENFVENLLKILKNYFEIKLNFNNNYSEIFSQIF